MDWHVHDHGVRGAARVHARQLARQQEGREGLPTRVQDP